MGDKTDASHCYALDSIQILKGLEAVRKRPGMYVGDTSDGSGLHNLVFEVLDAAIVQALAGFATEISVTLSADGSAIIRDNGRGLPTDICARKGISAAEVVMTELLAGRRFVEGGDNPCKVASSLQGVGMSVVNALSATLELRIWRDGKEHFMRFRQGTAEAPLRVLGPAQGKRGTEIAFWPDPEIFRNATAFDYATLERRLRELAFLTPGLRIVLTEGRHAGSRRAKMCYSGGIADLVRCIDRSNAPVIDAPIVIRGEMDGIAVDLALWWNNTHREQVLCFTNTVPQRNGGTHLAGLHAALARVISKYAHERRVADQEKVPIVGNDARSGLTAALAVWTASPWPFDQTRDRLGCEEVKAAVDSIVCEQLAAWLEAHPGQAKAILAKAQRVASARAICDFVRRPPAGHA